jgi:ubiquitin fusion degradation protein 1
MEVQYPLTFEIVSNHTKTHCGVLEFTSDEGMCCIPSWIMKNLDINEGDQIYIRNVSLNKATFIKFKPQHVKFLDLSDPRAVLEYVLRSFSCVTIGDKLHFDYNFQEYILEVTDVKPKKACCIIEADIEVDFDEPVGYVPKIQERIQEKIELPEPLKAINNDTPQPHTKSVQTNTSTKWGKTSKMAHFQGVGNKL